MAENAGLRAKASLASEAAVRTVASMSREDARTLRPSWFPNVQVIRLPAASVEVTATAFTNSQTIHAPAIGNTTLDPTKFTNSQTLREPVASVEVTASSFTNSQTFGSHTIEEDFAVGARGFGDQGVDANDVVTTPSSISMADGDDWSIFFWVWWESSQQTNFARPLHLGSSAGEIRFVEQTDGTFTIVREASTDHKANFPAVSTGQWVAVTLLYDASTDSWEAYYDGTQQTANSSSGSGSASSRTNQPVNWGNNGGQGFIGDCRLSECAIWKNRTLTSQEISDLSDGTKTPRDLPTSRVSYVPMNGSGEDEDLGTLSITGTAELSAPPAIT